jgi:hypothetical protein
MRSTGLLDTTRDCMRPTDVDERRGTGAATAQRRHGVGCLLARVARATGEGSMSNTEAWRDEENAPRVERPIGRVNVDDSVAAVPHTPHRTRSSVGS